MTLEGFIVFITSHSQYLSLTFKYQVEALDYIQKDDEDILHQRICNCIQNAYQKHVSRADEGSYIIKTQNGCRVSCAYSDILFFETDPLAARRLILHTKKRQYSFYGTLDKLFKELPKSSFFQCHKSFVVNLDNLSEKCKDDLTLGKDSIIMSNGSECRVSSRKRKNLLRLI